MEELIMTDNDTKFHFELANTHDEIRNQEFHVNPEFHFMTVGTLNKCVELIQTLEEDNLKEAFSKLQLLDLSFLVNERSELFTYFLYSYEKYLHMGIISALLNKKPKETIDFFIKALMYEMMFVSADIKYDSKFHYTLLFNEIELSVWRNIKNYLEYKGINLKCQPKDIVYSLEDFAQVIAAYLTEKVRKIQVVVFVHNFKIMTSLAVNKYFNHYDFSDNRSTVVEQKASQMINVLKKTVGGATGGECIEIRPKELKKQIDKVIDGLTPDCNFLTICENVSLIMKDRFIHSMQTAPSENHNIKKQKKKVNDTSVNIGGKKLKLEKQCDNLESIIRQKNKEIDSIKVLLNEELKKSSDHSNVILQKENQIKQLEEQIIELKKNNEKRKKVFSKTESQYKDTINMLRKQLIDKDSYIETLKTEKEDALTKLHESWETVNRLRYEITKLKKNGKKGNFPGVFG